MTIEQIKKIVGDQAAVTSSPNKVFIHHKVYRKALPAGCIVDKLVEGALRSYQAHLANKGIKSVYVKAKDPRIEITL